MKVLLPFLLSVLLVPTGSILAADVAINPGNLFKVNVRAVCRATNDQGAIVSARFGNDDLIKRCADANEISDLTTLTLVYNADADALQVVRVSDNAVICDALTFSGGTSVYNQRGTIRERLALISRDDTLVGSLIGKEWSLRAGNGNLLKLKFRAKFQMGTPAAGAEPAKLYTGFLTTGPRIAGSTPTPN